MDVNSLMEIVFNLLYLIAIYSLVIIMFFKFKKGLSKNRNIVSLFLGAFFLLALGDTGHVGFRVLAYTMGGLEKNSTLVGAGALATAVTVTFFYMITMELLYKYIHRGRDFLYFTVMVFGIVRLGFMTLPANQWGEVVPPLTYSYIRNLFLTLMGLIQAVMYLNTGIKNKDRLLKGIGICVIISYAFYMPVILFVRTVPALGMLMIPKTLAYVAIAVIGNKLLFNKK